MSDKPLAERLQVKNGRSFLVLNPPNDYHLKLEPLPEGSKMAASGEKADVVQFFVTSMTELQSMLPQAFTGLNPAGILWITYPKLTSKKAGDLNRDTIWPYLQTLGWTGVAMISIDETWSAFRAKQL
jgi:hypothetical protein